MGESSIGCSYTLGGIVQHMTTATPASGRRIVIVGGVAGGMSAATRLRRLDEDAQITVLERSGHVSFANCGLPYHVGGVIEDREALLLQTPESLHERFALDVLVRHAATRIDRDRRVVVSRDLRTGTLHEHPYDALVLSPGARPVRPPIPGIDRALSLRDIEDTDALVAATVDAWTAVVIGGGFIGVELAENLVRLGLEVTLVEAGEQVLAPLDPEMVAPVHDRLRAHGVRLHLGAAVTDIGADSVTLSDGSTAPADLVVAAIGVRPETSLAEAAGLDIGPAGGIAVDDSLRTNDPRIWAVGDAVEKRDTLSAEPVLVPLANTANLQGRMVADLICGRPARLRGVSGTAIVGVFGLQVATTGWNEKRLRAAARRHRVIHVHPTSHAGYYTGAESMALKLLVDPETDAILGAQGVGVEGVDKRIDVIATAMAGGLTASELTGLELAYAPQFGSAKDPVNMLGYLAENLADGLARTVQWHELADRMAEGAVLVDVRTPAEHAEDSIPGSTLIELDALRDRLPEIPRRPVIVHCAVGLRGHTAARLLAQHGYDVANLDGGIRTWRAGTCARSERMRPTAVTAPG
jgi:NADPH-dependent 2,4-dienoyl-CoA reductase/sulfur reductase-like enzyme/rhodanese-related sulfurtransferase